MDDKDGVPRTSGPPGRVVDLDTLSSLIWRSGAPLRDLHTSPGCRGRTRTGCVPYRKRRPQRSLKEQPTCRTFLLPDSLRSPSGNSWSSNHPAHHLNSILAILWPKVTITTVHNQKTIGEMERLKEKCMQIQSEPTFQRDRTFTRVEQHRLLTTSLGVVMWGQEQTFYVK